MTRPAQDAARGDTAAYDHQTAPSEPLAPYPDLSPDERTARAQAFFESMRTRRSVRDFKPDTPPRAVIEAAIKTAGTAPNGANMQPWTFVVVEDAGVKRAIREAAEEEEKAFYAGRAGKEWLDALAHLGTDWQKPYLETAPYLIVVFQQNYGLGPGGERIKHYYVKESVGLACGLLLAGLHQAGLATLTHTPSPMGFLNEILERPANEKPFMIVVTGQPTEECRVPVITKKPFDQICRWK